MEYSKDGVVGKMPNTEKYALSFEGKDKSGWIEMTNPSNEIMHIFVSYMTTGPPPSKYPKVEAAREDGDDTKRMLDPVANWGDQQDAGSRFRNGPPWRSTTESESQD